MRTRRRAREPCAVANRSRRRLRHHGRDDGHGTRRKRPALRPDGDARCAEAVKLMTPKPKILLAKVGLDGHDRGVKVVASLLQTAGMEVVYLGIHQTSEAIVEAAIQEDVDVVGLSSLGGAHLQYAETIVELMRARGLEHVPVVLGGTLPVE